MLPSHLQAMRDVECCRTVALGGHVYSCPECDQVQYQYHSCRNRHCPKCQGQKGQQWLGTQQDNLLPVPYFILTFTLPDELRTRARSHQRLFYSTLFRTSAAAAKRLALDPKYVGGQIGMVGVLHTWGRGSDLSSPSALPDSRRRYWRRWGMASGQEQFPVSCEGPVKDF